MLFLARHSVENPYFRRIRSAYYQDIPGGRIEGSAALEISSRDIIATVRFDVPEGFQNGSANQGGGEDEKKGCNGFHGLEPQC